MLKLTDNFVMHSWIWSENTDGANPTNVISINQQIQCKFGIIIIPSRLIKSQQQFFHKTRQTVILKYAKFPYDSADMRETTGK